MDIGLSHYLGILEEGVLALLSINYDNEYFEGTYWYDDKNNMIITFDRRLLDKLNIEITNEYTEYENEVKKMSLIVIPYEEGIKTLERLDIV